jgi:DNA uptake protein ComE-like DNA-binding protein
MNLNIEPLKNWFGFSRRERRSSFILLVIIVVIIGLRYTLPDSNLKITDITGKHLSEKDLDIPAATKTSLYSGKSSTLPIRKPYYIKEKPGFDKKSKGPSSITTISNGKSGQSNTGKQRTKVDINTCDSAALVMLPGIGPVLSARIIRYRRLLGGYARIEQMKEVYGLPEETFELIKGRVFADSTLISKVNINTAVYKELAHLHYLEKYEITAILKYRQLKGKINNIGDLTGNKLISLEKAIKVRPYLKFD